MKRRLVSLALVGFVVLPVPLRAAQRSGSPVEEGLRLFLENRLDPATLRITYSDVHALFGGQEFSVRGTGSVEAKFVRQKAEPMHRLPSVQVRDLVELLLQIEAWRQLTPDRQLRPDESRARLTIEVGSNSSEIWEWYNDYGPAFAIKAIRPAIPLWLLFIAVQLVDVAWAVLVLPVRRPSGG